MNVETVARNIQVIIAPVVMITACAILLQGLVNRYNALNDRMRAMTRERFDLLHSGGERDAVTTERLEELDTQLPDLLHRHKLVRDSVLSVYIAVMLYLASMFVIAFAALANSAEIATAALVLFLLGTAVLLLGIWQTVLEVRSSHHAIEYEVARVTNVRTTTK